MIGLTILAVRSSTPASLILETFGPSRIHIPKAPGLGLLLCEPHYAEYNKKVVEANSKLDSLVEAKRLDAAGAEEQKRDIIDIGIFKESIENFKQAEVYTRMWEVEQRDAV
jgi:tRNA pseudouridine38-40 synthase